MDETSRPYKVMRLIARLNIGGPAIHTTLLTERLNPQIFESKLVTGLEAGHEGNMLDLMGKTAVRPLIIPSLGREISPSNDLRTLYQVARLMRQYKPDIVHTHTAKAGFVGRMAARLAHVPIIVHTFHGNVFRGYFSPKKTKLFIDIEKFLGGFTDRIIVLSDQQRQEILSLGIGRADQYQIIPLGLNLTPFLEADTLRGQLRAELQVGPDVPLVGIVARLVPIKAIHFFIEAAKKVLATHPHALFLIVGDGELRTELETQAKALGVDKAVKFMGFRGDLPRIYADLNCSVLCSLNEGLPVAVIEALAAARPVVATDVGGVKDLIGSNETGWLVPAQNVDALAQAINEALANPALAAQRAQAGREHVYPALDIKRLVGDIETLYLDLLRKKGMLNKG
ncbi:MAG: glycosyltransferase family 4 protein [Abitibacteriaceae bacterium]|nr:glycosyltransferase family 4 protein [Abditibacteriaceae bacterium]